MSVPDRSMRIGEVLREGRRRAGLEIVDVEETTKIRIKYLRALEAEEWDALPSPAYAKGFLRTYGQLLGLDGEALVDEYRRQVEVGREPAPFGGGPPPGRESRRGAPKPPSQGPPPMFPPIVPIVAGVVILIAIALAVIGLVGGSGEDGGDGQGASERRAEQREAERRREQRAVAGAAEGETTIVFEVRDDTAVCLVDQTPEPLLDGAIQRAGTSVGPETAERFEIRFPEGYSNRAVALRIDAEPADLPDGGEPVALRIEDGSTQELGPPSGSCP